MRTVTRARGLALAAVLVGLGLIAPATAAPTPGADEALATGNEWLALPEIRPSDAALLSFNVLSARDRGLLEVRGDGAHAALEPHFDVDGHAVAFKDPSWTLRAEWIPEATLTVDGIDYTVTYCAPDGFRAAFVRLAATNHRDSAARVSLGLRSAFGALRRVTYVPVALRGERRVGPAAWVGPGEQYSFVTDDTHFSWALVHPGSSGTINVPPVTEAPEADATQTQTLEPNGRVEAVFVLATGIEEFSAAHAARALREALDRLGSEAVLARTEAWCRARSRTTGQADLDRLMNRNLLFTRLYAWGRTFDTEQLVGVTSRSPRYYVSAAYWDRDALLWSFPGLLDADPVFAREALTYALTVQRRNVGTHSRFIDGTVLEDGFQLDEAAAPLIALTGYVAATGDLAFARDYRAVSEELEARLLARRDARTGLYESMQDAQDEYQKRPFITYDNVLVWKAYTALAALRDRLGDTDGARAARRRAQPLREAILTRLVTGDGAAQRFVAASDGRDVAETDIPPGSLLTLPELGFLPESDPRFVATYAWLHSPAYRYSHAETPYGLPGSYRLPFTTVWTLDAELGLARGRAKALDILRASPWDNGIATEGIDPTTARPDRAGRAFATAAGQLGHTLCAQFCTDTATRSVPATR
jgi:uncharacterized protein